MRRTFAIGAGVVVVGLVASCRSSDPAPSAPAGSAHHEDRHAPATAAPKLVLDVTVDGAPVKWQADAFGKVPRIPAKNTSGESRDAWSLRELATTLAGPGARVVSITGAEGQKPIDAAAWADPARIPIVHTTRRGSLKFRWTDAAGAWGESDLKDVTRLEIVRAK